MNNIKDSWDQIKEKIADEYGLSDVSYTTWIKPLKIGPVTEDTVTILIPSDQSHALNYISSKYKDFFQVTISEMFDQKYEISFRLEQDSDISFDHAGIDPAASFGSRDHMTDSGRDIKPLTTGMLETIDRLKALEAQDTRKTETPLFRIISKASNE